MVSWLKFSVSFSTIGGGDGLAWTLRVGGEGERRRRAVARDDDLVKGELIHSVGGGGHRFVHIRLHRLCRVGVRAQRCCAERYAEQGKAAG